MRYMDMHGVFGRLKHEDLNWFLPPDGVIYWTVHIYEIPYNLLSFLSLTLYLEA